jgi:O-antigen ligase
MIVLAIVYLSYYSLSQYFFSMVPAIRVGGFGLYENPNDLSIILVTSIPLALLVANSSKSSFVRYLFVCIAGLYAFNILFTGSRNGLLGLLSVGAMGLLMVKKMNKPFKYLLIAVLAGAIFTVGKTHVLSRNDLTALSGDESSESRLEQWRAGLKMLSERPVLGIGPFQFSDEAENYGGIKGMEAHNTLLQVFSETGLAGGIVFSLFTFYPFYRGWLLMKDGRFAGSQGLANYKFLMASLAGFWVCAVFTNRYHFYSLYILVGLLVSSRQALLSEKRAAAENG